MLSEIPHFANEVVIILWEKNNKKEQRIRNLFLDKLRVLLPTEEPFFLLCSCTLAFVLHSWECGTVYKDILSLDRVDGLTRPTAC